MRAVTLSLLVLLTSLSSFAQKIDKAFFESHLKTNSYSLDPDADAVVLYEKSTAEVVSRVNKYGIVQHVYRVVKILKSAAVDEASISERYHSSSNFQKSVKKIDGTTYNLEGDQVVKTELEKSAIFSRKLTENIYESKFTMPAVKVGSIIEYSYDIESDFDINLPYWQFQNKFPTICSEYDISVPVNFHYVFVTQGDRLFKEYNSLKSLQKDSAATAYTINLSSSGTNLNVIRWGARNLPAIKDEPFISSVENHVVRIDIQLSGFNDYQTAFVHKVMSDWDKFNNELLTMDKFGGQLNGKNRYLDTVAKRFAENGNTLIAAKRAFDYVRTSFKCYDTIALLVTRDLDNVFKDKTGNAAELNLLLTNLLTKMGMEAQPVVLSTMGNQKVNEFYPFADRFNHTVCMVKVNGQTYLMDASDKYNAFNFLPRYCYNGYARVVKDEGESVQLASRMVKERTVITVNIPVIRDTLIELDIVEIHGMYTSGGLRRSWNKDESNKINYINERGGATLDDVELKSYKVENMTNVDTNLVVKYKLVKHFAKPISTLHLNTDYFKFFSENPFKAMHRTLPIELPSQLEYVYAMNVTLPSGAEVEDLPAPAIITYESNQMTYRHLVNHNKELGMLSATSKFVASETIFPVEGYDVIREFFEKMILETNRVLTIKMAK